MTHFHLIALLAAGKKHLDVQSQARFLQTEIVNGGDCVDGDSSSENQTQRDRKAPRRLTALILPSCEEVLRTKHEEVMSGDNQVGRECDVMGRRGGYLPRVSCPSPIPFAFSD
jgi:hypothetical protein